MGKTTTVRSIMACSTQQGTISFQNAYLWASVVRIARPDRPGARGPQVFPNLTVRETFSHGRNRRGGKILDPRAVYLLFPNLKERRNNYATSSPRRAADARIAGADDQPRLLILDEATRASPLYGGDLPLDRAAEGRRMSILLMTRTSRTDPVAQVHYVLEKGRWSGAAVGRPRDKPYVQQRYLGLGRVDSCGRPCFFAPPGRRRAAFLLRFHAGKLPKDVVPKHYALRICRCRALSASRRRNRDRGAGRAAIELNASPGFRRGALIRCRVDAACSEIRPRARDARSPQAAGTDAAGQ